MVEVECMRTCVSRSRSAVWRRDRCGCIRDWQCGSMGRCGTTGQHQPGHTVTVCVSVASSCIADCVTATLVVVPAVCVQIESWGGQYAVWLSGWRGCWRARLRRWSNCCRMHER